MIPTATPITEVDKMPGTEVAFSIGNPLWVMKNLAKLYSDTSTAVIREYSTNGVDSHIMAGKADVPIEVTLPTLYDPYFTVQDFGLGMSEKDLTETYTSFGDSTKRETNDVNGMYGFGSKSAVAYTNQFTIVAVKDGEETHAIVSKRPDYSMTLKVVSKRSTDAQDGVKITIPVHNREEFRTKAKNFYRFWQPGTVLVDGEQPVQAVGEKIDEGLYFSPNPGTSYVVMGNVGYRIANPDAIFRNSRMNAISFVAYVEGGAVEHTPSREDLEYTDHTKATLHKVIRDFEEKVLSEAKKQIETATSSQEAWELWNSWGDKIGSNVFAGMEYNGIKLVNSFSTPDTKRYKVPVGGYNSRYNLDHTSSANVKDAHRILFVTEHLTDQSGYIQVATDHKKKARVYFNHVGLKDIKYVYFMKGTVDSPWVPKENIVTWNDLKAALPKIAKVASANRPKRPKGLFDYYTVKGTSYAKEIPAGSDVLYVTASDAKTYEVVAALQAMNADADVVVVNLAVNRIEKFKRDNFGTREFMEWARKKVVVDTETLLDERAKLALNLGHNTIQWVNRLDDTKIDDPKWKLVKELTGLRSYTEKYNKNLELARSLGMRYDIKEYRASGSDDSLIDKYPLLSRISLGYNSGDDVKKEIITYINAAYAAQKGKP
jgi:hypothetical protein